MILLFTLLTWISPPTLTIRVEDITPTKGSLMIGIFDKHSFEEKDNKGAIKYIEHPINSSTVEIPVSLAKGKYGIKIYHDINSNKELDFNFLGIPKEPYGFSNNATGFMSAPSYENCEFSIGDKPVVQNITLR